MKLLILVIDVKKEPWLSITNYGIKNTWFNHNNPNVDIYFIYGDCNSNKIENNEIQTTIKESIPNIGYKMVETLKMIDTLEYDFIFRTNTSSYVDVDKLYNKLLEIANDDLYAGVIGRCGCVEFCSGAGYFLSKKNVKLVNENPNLWEHFMVDDVALGNLLSKFNVKKTSLERTDYSYINGIETNFVDTYHYRCICPNRKDGGSSDIEIMKKIHEKKCL